MKSKEEIEQLAQIIVPTPMEGTSYVNVRNGFIIGYTQCQEDMQKDVKYWQGEFDHWHQQAMEMADKKYTEEDIREAIDMARQLSHVSCLEDGEHRLKYSNTEDEIINSLNKQDNE